jgi:hypothetical protein
MVIYFGYFQPNEAYSVHRTQKILSGEWPAPQLGQNPDAAMADKVRGFPGFLSSIGVTLIGSYTPVGQGLSDTTPGVTIVETDDPSKLNQITMYYQPYLNYRFQTYQQVQRPS